MNFKTCVILFMVFLILTINASNKGTTKELPPPDFNHTFYMTFFIPIGNNSYFFNEVNLIKAYFKNNFYNKIGVSEFISLSTIWNHPEDYIPIDLHPVFNEIRENLSLSKNLGIGLHIGFIFGFVRKVDTYNEAKKDDNRNCQWYSDGKLASDDQLKNMDVALDTYIWLTLSRYALELRNRLKKVCYSAGPFLKEIEKDYSQTFIAASGDGEVELNYHRKDSSQDFPITDYSPFAIREFRDWILHQGLYDDEDGLYKGEGYEYGGNHYCDLQGLDQFNLEFDTEFQTWDLKYYHFELNDLALTEISWDDIRDKGNLLPSETSPHYITGGFDAPRKYDPGSGFWRLWERFRQEMVRNHTRDIAKWVVEKGFQSGRWYSHQIPADYLWGRYPGQGTFESRLLSSASPLWTAHTSPFGKTGVTCFDIKFPDGYKRTTEYLLPALKSTGKDWAAMEFDPFTIPPQFNLSQENDINLMYEKYKQTYDAGVHLMAIYKWEDTTGEHQTKGTRKIDALKKMWTGLPNLPWKDYDLYSYYPPSIKNLVIAEEAEGLKLSWNQQIWYDLDYCWDQLAYFKCFEVYQVAENEVEFLLGLTKNNFMVVEKPEADCCYYIKAVFDNNSKSKNKEIICYHQDKRKAPYFPESIKYINMDSGNSQVSGFIRIVAGTHELWTIENNMDCLHLEKQQGIGSDLISFELAITALNENTPALAKIDLLANTTHCVDSLYFYLDFDDDINPLSERDELI
ncbi:MAG: hypothetical protein KAT17_05055, partial [Candidatus Aminicenantes bacterium]|nr:hypothetical protein [Candidatus Aminicenantes bacterium]